MAAIHSKIFSAEDYRQLLKAVVNAEKQANKTSSLRLVAEKVGINLSTFKMILDGSRNLTIENIHKIASGLKMTGEERDFLEWMVLRDQAENKDVQAHYARKLKNLVKSRRVSRFRSSDISLIQHWFSPALIVYLLDVERVEESSFDDEAFKRASRRFKVPPKLVQETFENLRNEGIICSLENNKYHIVVERIRGGLAKQKYLADIFMECSRRMQDEFHNPLAMFTAHTLSVPRSMVPTFFEEYKQLLEKYMGFDNVENDLEIMQVCSQAIPMLKSTEAK